MNTIWRVIFHVHSVKIIVVFTIVSHFSSAMALKCLLSFDAESFVFHVAIQKFKDQNIYRTIIFLLFCMGVKLGL